MITATVRKQVQERQPIGMTLNEAEAWRQRVCLCKVSMGQRASILKAAALAAQTGRPYRSYRCPFAVNGQRHWHVGKVISVESMHLVAQAMRTLAS